MTNTATRVSPKRSMTAALIPFLLGISSGGARADARPTLAGRLETASVTRGASAIDRSDFDEHVDATAEGIEESWTFRSRPAGDSDLVVRVRLLGERFVHVDRTGLHFVEDSTGRGMRYGHGTWVDARGARVPVRARFEGGLVELTVPSSVVDSSAFPAILDPSVGPEFPIDPAVYPPTKEAITSVAVGYGAGVYLVVWQDTDVNSQLLAVRVRSGDGVVLDATPALLSSPGAATSRPAIAFDGTAFFVGWDGGAARLRASDGALLDPATGFTTPARLPSVTYAGGSYVEVWDSLGTVSDVTIQASSATVGPMHTVSASGAGEPPAAASNGANVLLAWTDKRNGALNPDIYGSLAASTDFAIAQSFAAQSRPAAASDGTDFFVAWYDARTNSGVYGARVRASDGTVLDGSMSGVPVAFVGPVAPQVSFDGTSYVVAYNAQGTVHAARVRPTDGALLDGAATSGGIAVTFDANPSASLVAIASGPTESLVAWVTGGTGGPAVRAARIRSSDGAVLDASGLPISPPLGKHLTGANAETFPVVATDGTGYLVSWTDDRNAMAFPPITFAMVLDGSGRQGLPQSVRLFIAPDALAFDGTHFLSSNGASGLASRIRPSDGNELDLPNGIPLRPAATGFSYCTDYSRTACLQGTCLVAYVCAVPKRGFSTHDQLFVQRLRAIDGTPLDGPGVQVTTTNDSNNDIPLVGAGSSSFLVVWVNSITGFSDTIQAARVDLAGGVTPFTVAPAGRSGITEAVAFDGTNFLVLWEAPGGLWATRVRESDGLVIDGAPGQGALPLAAMAGANASATYDGQNYVAVFGDSRTGTPAIYATRIRPSDGAILDGPPSNSGFLVRMGLDAIYGTVTVTSPGSGRSLIVAPAQRGAPFGALRLSGQFVDESDAGIPGTDASAGLPDAMGARPVATADAAIEASVPSGGDATPDATADATAPATDATVIDDSSRGQAAVLDATLSGDARVIDATAAADASAPSEAGPSGGDAAGQGGSGNGGGGCQCRAVPLRGGRGGILGMAPLVALLVALRRRQARCR